MNHLPALTLAAILALGFTSPFGLVDPARAAAPAAEDRVAEAFAVAMRDAVASGDARRVMPLFPAGGPAWTWLGQRWAEMRKGTLDPETWEAGFTPLYARADRVGGVLTLTARARGAALAQGRFELEIVRRGRAWVVGDALPLARPDARIDRHDLRVDLREPGRVTAEDVLTIDPTGPDPRFFLALDPTLRVSAVSGPAGPLTWKQDGELLYVSLPGGDAPFPLTIAYAGPLPGNEADGALLRAESPWYPRPVGAPAPAVFRLMAMVKPGEQAVGGGDFVGVDRYGDGWLYHWTTPRPAPGMAVVTGRLGKAEASGGVVGLSAYVREGHEAIVPPLLAETAAVTGFFAKRYGFPAYRRLALVESDAPEAYGLGGALALPTGVFQHAETADAILAPALARGWSDRRRYAGTPGEQAFMTEGVAAYLALLYHGERDGGPAFRRELITAQRRWAQVVGSPEDVAIKAAVMRGDRETWRRTVWDKGAMVLHMLRRHIGAPAFDAALANLWAGPADQPVDVAAFRAAFEKASGKHLGAFFDQWLGRAGRPDLVAEGVEARKVGKAWEVTGVVTQATGAPFHLQLPLVVATDKDRRVYYLDVTGAATPFKLAVPLQPRSLMIDPLRDTLVSDAPDVSL